MITDAGLARVLALINQDLEYFGLGSGLPPDVSSESLDQEVIRKAAATTVDGETLIKEVYLDETEGNGIHLTSAGIFGDGASSALGTGKLFAGSEIDVSKDQYESITVSIEITVEAR